MSSEAAQAPDTGNERTFELGCDGPMVLVVGVDGSDTSWRALAYALGQARRQGSTVATVFARSAAVTAGASAGVVIDSTVLDDQAAELRGQIAKLANELGVRATFSTVVADPAAALHAVAEKFHADAIIVGASEHRAHRVYGSTAVRTVRQGKWPVTVVP